MTICITFDFYRSRLCWFFLWACTKFPIWNTNASSAASHTHHTAITITEKKVATTKCREKIEFIEIGIINIGSTSAKISSVIYSLPHQLTWSMWKNERINARLHQILFTCIDVNLMHIYNVAGFVWNRKFNLKLYSFYFVIYRHHSTHSLHFHWWSAHFFLRTLAKQLLFAEINAFPFEYDEFILFESHLVINYIRNNEIY